MKWKHSHCQLSQTDSARKTNLCYKMEAFTLPAEPIRLGKHTSIMKWKRSHCQPNRTNLAWKTNLRYEMEAFTLPTELIRLGKQTCVMKWKHSHCQPNRTRPSVFPGCLFLLASRRPILLRDRSDFLGLKSVCTQKRHFLVNRRLLHQILSIN
jgi:hypothetical protein